VKTQKKILLKIEKSYKKKDIFAAYQNTNKEN